MPGTSLIFSPDTPAWAHIRSVENWYQIALIADNTSHLRHFMVRSQIAQVEALREANTQLAQMNAGLIGGTITVDRTAPDPRAGGWRSGPLQHRTRADRARAEEAG